MAAIAATILISPKLEEAAGIAVEFAGKPKVAAAMMWIEDQMKKDGKDAWCAMARNAFPPLTERYRHLLVPAARSSTGGAKYFRCASAIAR